MRCPSMMTPEPVTSAGPCLAHGFTRSGRRSVEKTLTTAVSASWDMAGVGSDAGVAATTEPAFLLASLVDGGSAANTDSDSSGASKQPQTSEYSERVIREGIFCYK